jgi:hypothetical protein
LNAVRHFFYAHPELLFSEAVTVIFICHSASSRIFILKKTWLIMIKLLCLLPATFLLFACNSANTDRKADVADSLRPDTSVKTNPADTTPNLSSDSMAHEIATLHLVVADTGADYDMLDKKMERLSRQYKMEIDRMDRFYNSKKKLIALPENHSDKLYAGTYVPRRFPSGTLSLEYLKTYQPGTGEKTIALVAGIFEKEQSADSVLALLQQAEKKAFKLKANIDLGCIH